MSRHSLRAVLILIIIATIPCYIIGFGILVFTPENNVEQTATPIETATIVTDTETPTTEATLGNSPTTFVIVTLNPIAGITQIVPTSILFSTSTAISTNIPVNTAIPTTAPVVNTAIPSATQPILLPPTDTPSP
jgi:hypothetical protein